MERAGTKWISRIWLAAVALIFLLLGITGERGLHLTERLQAAVNFDNIIESWEDGEASFRDDFGSGAAAKPCPAQDSRTMVAVLVGQSNAANYAERRTQSADPRVSVFYRGHCYPAKDPILGATGRRGSIWPQFAEDVLRSGRYDQVVLVPAAVGGTSMESWTPGGILFDRIESRLTALKEAELRPTHFLIIQGEYEADWPQAATEYQQNAIKLLNALQGTGARVYMASVSRCKKSQNTAIKSAQDRARQLTHTKRGPDLDAIGPEHRINGCHLDFAAQSRLASEWTNVVISDASF